MSHGLLKPAVIGTALAGVFALIAPAFAHHSGAMFDRDKKVELEGTIRTFEWVQPHSRIWIYADTITDVTDPKKPIVRKASAPELWSIEQGAPSLLARGGWTKETLKAGDKATIIVNPLRSGAHGAGGGNIKLVNGKPFARPKGDFGTAKEGREAAY